MQLRRTSPILVIVAIAAVILVLALVIFSQQKASPPPSTETPTEVPTETPTETLTVVLEPTSEVTEEPGSAEAEATDTGPAKASSVPAGSGIFMMGTNAEEIAAAIALCAPEDNCDAARADDSMPEHYVSLSPYQIELYEVSNADYAAFLNSLGAGSHLDACLGEACILTQEDTPESNITFDGETYAPAPDADNLPVTHVSWYGAQAYCESFGRRLPSEAEWELAARSARGYVYPWGAEFDPKRANTAASGNNGLTPVDSYPGGRSHYGVQNMTGNVAEWTLDWYDADFYSVDIVAAATEEATVTEEATTADGADAESDAADATEEASTAEEVVVSRDPIGPETGEMRVIRGGSWQDVPFYARTPQRAAMPPEAMVSTVGFRCAESGWPLPDAPLAETLSRYEGFEAGILEDGTPYLGALDAPVVLVEFFQFTCPHCNNFRVTLHELLPYVEAGQLRIESRPLVNSNQMTLWAAAVSLCAGQQAPIDYWFFHDYIFDGVSTEGIFALVSHRVLQRAEVFGIDKDVLEACLADEARTTTLQNNIDESAKIGLTGVPTVLLNGERISNPDTGEPMSGEIPLQLLQDAIDALLEETAAESE